MEEPTAIPAIAPLLGPDDFAWLSVLAEGLLGGMEDRDSTAAVLRAVVLKAAVLDVVAPVELDEAKAVRKTGICRPRFSLQQVVLSGPQQ